MKPRIIAFILAFKAPPLLTLKSLLNQTLRPDKIVIVAAYKEACMKNVECLVVPPRLELTVGERVGIALTLAFKKYKIENYDYIVKLDDDVILDKEFLEKNISAKLDLIGRGAAMIIRTSSYIKCIGKRWPITSADDTFVVEVMMAKGFKTMPFWWPHPAKLLKEPSGDLKRGWRIGIESYRLGLHPLRVISSALRALRRKEPAALSIIPGYIYALLSKQDRYSVADEVKRFNRMYIKMKILKLLGIRDYNIEWIYTES